MKRTNPYDRDFINRSSIFYELSESSGRKCTSGICLFDEKDV